MAANIRVRQNTRPQQFFQLKDFRNPSDPNALIDITAYSFRLMVKRDLADADAQAFFDLAGVIAVALDGSVRFDLTAEHTAMPVGRYPGEIRWWSDAVETNPPTDAVRFSYIVEDPVDKIV